MAMDDTEYERIRKYVVEPLVNELRSDLKGMQQAMLSFNERFERQFAQHERSLEHTAAMIRNANDPLTGSITRSELRIMQETAEKEHLLIRREVQDSKEESESRLGDYETRLRTLERNLVPPWLLPVVSLVLAVISTLVSHVIWK